MRKDLTELVFILDRSGSMRGLESDTIGGFNAMLAKQKKEQGAHGNLKRQLLGKLIFPTMVRRFSPPEVSIFSQ